MLLHVITEIIFLVIESIFYSSLINCALIMLENINRLSGKPLYYSRITIDILSKMYNVLIL